MKDILLIGDIIVHSRVYNYSNIEDVLELKEIIFDNIRIDSIYKIKQHFYIWNPIQYKDELINSIEEYKMIVLSLFSYDINTNRYDIRFLNSDYFNKYEEIIKKVREKCKKLLIIFPHKPYLGEESNESHFEEEINNCYILYYNFIINMAKKYKFSILNLDKSFDCKNRDNYIYNCHIFINGNNNIKIGTILIKIYEELNENSIYSIK